MWSSEGDNGEIESKDGIYKHHVARGRSDWSRRVRGNDTGERREKVQLLYALDASGPNNGVFKKG
jgi:hypothetical protein